MLAHLPASLFLCGGLRASAQVILDRGSGEYGALSSDSDKLDLTSFAKSLDGTCRDSERVRCFTLCQ